jgi:hypothetical protein
MKLLARCCRYAGIPIGPMVCGNDRIIVKLSKLNRSSRVLENGRRPHLMMPVSTEMNG